MTRSIGGAIYLALSLLSAPSPLEAAEVLETGAAAEEAELEVGYRLESSLATTYVSRGVPQYVSRDDPSSQSTAMLRLGHLGPGALTLGVGNATALTDLGAQPGTAVQLDFSATYTLALAPALELSAGYVYSLCPMQQDPNASVNPAQELTVELAWTTALARPSIFVAVEFAAQHGAYAAATLARDVALGPLTLTPAVGLGVAAYRRYGGADASAGLHVNDLTASVDARIAVSEEAYALLRGSWSLRGTPDALLAEPDRAQRSVAYAAVGFGVSR